MPPPNGIQVYVSGGSSTRNRSGRNALGVRVQVVAAMNHPDRGVDLDPGRDLVAVQAERLAADDPADARDHRPHAERLLDHRVEIPLVALRGARSSTAGCVQQQVEAPREPGGGRLVPRQQQRHELVADLAVGQPLRRPRPRRAAAPRRCRRAARAVGVGAAARDLRVQHLVDRLARGLERAVTAAWSPRTNGSAASSSIAARPRQRLEHRPQPPAELVLLGAGLVSEHRAEDHPQRQRLHARQQRERLADRPGVDLEVGRRHASRRRRPASAGRGTGASIRRRWRRCWAPSSSSTERSPTIGPSITLASPARSCSCESLEQLLDQRRDGTPSRTARRTAC